MARSCSNVFAPDIQRRQTRSATAGTIVSFIVLICYLAFWIYGAPATPEERAQ